MRWGHSPSLPERITTSAGFVAPSAVRVWELGGCLCSPAAPGALGACRALHNGHFAPAASSECVWATWDTGKRVSMATCTSEMPTRKFALGEKNILLQLTLQRGTEVGCSSPLQRAWVKIALLPVLLQCSALAALGWHTVGRLMALGPCHHKATPSCFLQPLCLFHQGQSVLGAMCSEDATSTLWLQNGRDMVQEWVGLDDLEWSLLSQKIL